MQRLRLRDDGSKTVRTRPMIIGHHLIWALYGHWLPNDPRGSGSQEIRQHKLASLGPIHLARKPAHLQPTRGELRSFQKEAEPALEFSRCWSDDAKRQSIGDAFSEIVAKRGYTVWACAILSNHMHAVIRRHRDDALAMWEAVADATRVALRVPGIHLDHPIWSTRPYKVFLLTPAEVRSRIVYVAQNPKKEGLTPQEFRFVRPYDDWPFHKSHPPKPR